MVERRYTCNRVKEIKRGRNVLDQQIKRAFSGYYSLTKPFPIDELK